MLGLLADDDHSGTLDTAECDSLFRLLYHTDELSPDIKKILADVDSNSDGLLSLGTFPYSVSSPCFTSLRTIDEASLFVCADEFLQLCSRNKMLMSPIFTLQSRAREKKEPKEVSAIPTKEPFVPVVDKPPTQPPTLQPKASERLAAKQKQQELKALETWIQEHRQQPVIHDYFVAFSDKFMNASRPKRLLEIPRPSADDVKLITELRYSAAVSAKRFDAAKAKMTELWEIEQQSMIEKRHEAVKGMVKGVSAKTLLKQTGKQSAASAVGNYLQKKLDEAEQDVRRQVQERWETLDRAATHIAQQDLTALDEASNRQPVGSLFAKDDSGRYSARSAFGHERTKVVPIDESEAWTEHFDEAQGRYYYVSSLGYSTWDRPESYVAQ